MEPLIWPTEVSSRVEILHCGHFIAYTKNGMGLVSGGRSHLTER